MIELEFHTRAETKALQEEIRELARQKDAIIIAHNYQRPEVQDVAVGRCLKHEVRPQSVRERGP